MTKKTNNGRDFPVYPQLQFNNREYADLKGRLHLFSDYIVLEKFHQGSPTESYIVDPLELSARLSRVPLTTGCLPRNCLFWSRKDGEDRVGIYIEPGVWPVSVWREKLTWHVPLPGLVFVGHENKYGLFAVKGQYWPGPDTRLYHAPCPNTYSRNGICAGNVSFPKAGMDTIWQAVDAFFESEFNDHLSNSKSKAHPDNVLKQWRKLWKAKAEVYPEDDLVESDMKLSNILV